MKPRPPSKVTGQAAKRRVKREAQEMLAQGRKRAELSARRAEAIVQVGKRGRGRQGLLDDRLATKVVGYVLEGTYISVAAQACGVHASTMSVWQSRAEEWIESPIDEVPEAERIYVDFYHAIRIAEAQAEVGLLRCVADGKFGWQAAMTILERRHPDRWKRRDTVQHEGGDPSKPIRSVAVPSDDERAVEVAGILKQAEALGASPAANKSSKSNGSRRG